jgi:hypothetical protein
MDGMVVMKLRSAAPEMRREGRGFILFFSHLRAMAIDDDSDGKAGDGDNEAKDQQGTRHATKRGSHTGTL